MFVTVSSYVTSKLPAVPLAAGIGPAVIILLIVIAGKLSRFGSSGFASMLGSTFVGSLGSSESSFTTTNVDVPVPSTFAWFTRYLHWRESRWRYPDRLRTRCER